MKATKITSIALAATIAASSCTSSYQAASGVTGAAIGSRVGEAVGFLSGHGHFRGENAALGSLIGMGVGAVLGVGIASQIEKNERDIEKRTDSGNYYDGRQDSQTSGGSYSSYDSYAGMAAPNVSISDLTYTDGDGDGYISKDETIEVEAFITNTSNKTISDIVIHLSTNGGKNFSQSPSLTTTLRPGQKIRYTGRIHCKKAKKAESVAITLNTSENGRVTTSNSLFVRER